MTLRHFPSRVGRSQITPLYSHLCPYGSPRVSIRMTTESKPRPLPLAEIRRERQSKAAQQCPAAPTFPALLHRLLYVYKGSTALSSLGSPFLGVPSTVFRRKIDLPLRGKNKLYIYRHTRKKSSSYNATRLWYLEMLEQTRVGFPGAKQIS